MNFLSEAEIELLLSIHNRNYKYLKKKQKVALKKAIENSINSYEFEDKNILISKFCDTLHLPNIIRDESISLLDKYYKLSDNIKKNNLVDSISSIIVCTEFYRNFKGFSFTNLNLKEIIEYWEINKQQLLNKISNLNEWAVKYYWRNI